ncbi:MAG: CHRD domain-containing protein, partial [Bacteroidia bacterium]
MKKMLFSFATVLWCVIQAQAITFKENLLFSAKMEGAQVVPAVATGAKGIGSLMLNKTRDSLAVNMSFNGLSGAPTSVWIYQGAAGVNGAQLIDLTAYMTGNRIAMQLSGAAVTGNIANLFKEDLYLLVATQANPTGEIRGQIKLESDWNFAADLTGMEAIPAVSGNAYGLGSFSLSLDKTKLSYRIICQNLTGAITGATLHFGAMGQTGTLVNDLTSSVNGNVISGTLVPTSMMLDSLFARKIYLNITTATNPTGELRSQLINYKGLTFEAMIDGGQMVPAIASPGQGISLIRLSPTMDTLYYDAVMDNINTNIDYAHLHVGNAGFAYGS